jgi:hypothetical protein
MTIAIASVVALTMVIDIIRVRAVVFLHFAFTGERIFRRMGATIIEANLRRIVLRGALHAVSAIRNRFQPGSRDGVATSFALAIGAVRDAL